jgi:putative two-component system hydrogenase maturation factor HypX/HoxX
MADLLTRAPFTPIGTREAVDVGLLDAAFGATVDAFRARVRRLAERMAHGHDFGDRLIYKRLQRLRDEQIKPLSAYRKEELARSHECFFGDDPSYHEARHRFVHKLDAPCTVLPAAAPEHRRAVAQ